MCTKFPTKVPLQSNENRVHLRKIIFLLAYLAIKLLCPSTKRSANYAYFGGRFVHQKTLQQMCAKNGFV